MRLNYASYLKLDRLLSLQQPLSEPEQHDEMLFIVIHQTYELWFKQLLHEFDRLKEELQRGELFPGVATLKRCRTIMKTLVGQLDVLETMTPRSFSAFRDRLETASGFQSTQFREVEFVLGYKRPETLKHYRDGTPGLAAVKRRLSEPSVHDSFVQFLRGRGARVPADYAAAGAQSPVEPNRELQDEIVRLSIEQPEVDFLLELLMDFDEGMQEWRYRHVKLVERTIGNKRGTGGSLGVEFLKRSLFRPAFPDLWAVRHRF